MHWWPVSFYQEVVEEADTTEGVRRQFNAFLLHHNPNNQELLHLKDLSICAWVMGKLFCLVSSWHSNIPHTPFSLWIEYSTISSIIKKPFFKYHPTASTEKCYICNKTWLSITDEMILHVVNENITGIDIVVMCEWELMLFLYQKQCIVIKGIMLCCKNQQNLMKPLSSIDALNCETRFRFW